MDEALEARGGSWKLEVGRPCRKLSVEVRRPMDEVRRWN